MPKRKLFSHDGFTLIEVIMAVVIVSTVIAALLQMRGNTSHKFLQLKKLTKTNQYNSFLIGNGEKYGFESSNIDLYRLADDFDLESNLRRKLKSLKVHILYDELDVLDSSDFGDEDEESSDAAIVLEIGRTTLHSKEFSLSMKRVKLQ